MSAHDPSGTAVVTHLADAHALEVQGLEQLRLAPRVAGDPELRRAFREHHAETEEHERLVARALGGRGARPSRLRDAAGGARGFGLVLFARLNTGTPGRLAVSSYAYEHLELATYELLGRLAARSGDAELTMLAGRLADEERTMAGRVARHWDRAVEATLRARDERAMRREVVAVLRDAHALERQGLRLLYAGVTDDGGPLAVALRDHLGPTRDHERAIEERLGALGSHPPRFPPLATRAGALPLGAGLREGPQDHVRLAAFAYAFAALEAGTYALLAQLARRTGDEETTMLALRLRTEEEVSGERIAATWDAVAGAAVAPG